MFLVNRRGFGLPSSFLSFKSFPWVKHTCVGVTIFYCMVFLAWGGDGAFPSFIGFVNCRWGVRFDLHMCWEKVFLLITRSSMVAPMGA
jgi:hypothetical protein